MNQKQQMTQADEDLKLNKLSDDDLDAVAGGANTPFGFKKHPKVPLPDKGISLGGDGVVHHGGVAVMGPEIKM
jgi:glutamate dehydrogenase/leucine dehydrogenase